MKGKRFWEIMYSLVSAINTISCIILLCIICPRVENLGFDYIGVIVAILALLVTLLIGWNIFTALDFRKEVSAKIEECRKQCRHELRLHSELNNKEFDNVVRTLQRAEDYCNKLDNLLYEHLTGKKKNEQD